MEKAVKAVLVIAVFVFLGWFFSYRILNTPLGLTADEGAFAYNAVLLSQTGRDENNRLLPVFVLSLNGSDWRQPVTQYYMALFFKIFGPSVFNLRFTSVVITLVSAILLFILSRHLFGRNMAILATGIFLTTPLIMIQSHLGLDNIMPVPFTIIWLLGLYLFTQTRKNKFLFIAGVSLGIAFYSYKGMRATVPVWYLLTAFYLFTQETFPKFIRRLLAFSLGIGPFFLAIPWLESLYPGAVFDRHTFNWNSIYAFLYPYFSSFDISFLFIQGDATAWHSTGRHGMMLLATLPLFVFGLYQAFRKKGYWYFVVASFFTAPLLFGFVGSVHRASRLMSIIPAYALISVLGATWLWSKKKIILVAIIFASIINYWDFVKFYWYQYPELTRIWFGDMVAYQDYQALGIQAKKLHRQPYISTQIVSGQGHSGRYFAAAYVGLAVKQLADSDPLPPNSLLMSQREEIPGLIPLPADTRLYHLFIAR